MGRWLTIAELAGCPVNIVHLSTLRGWRPCGPHGPGDSGCMWRPVPSICCWTSGATVCPALRAPSSCSLSPARAGKLRRPVGRPGGGEIDTIGTDHCSFRFHGAKELGREDFSKIPNGIPWRGAPSQPDVHLRGGGGRITAVDMARLLAENPARLFGMYPQKGVLAVGSDADLVIFDPNDTGRITAETQYQNVDYTPYEGMALRGRVDTVLLGGEVAVEGGRCCWSAGAAMSLGGPAVSGGEGGTMEIGCVLLCSGYGRRFGSNKLLALLDGVPSIAGPLPPCPPPSLQGGGHQPVWRDIGPGGKAGLPSLLNCHPWEGVAAGIRLGLAALRNMDGVLFSVCDQPNLTTKSIENLINSFLESPISFMPSLGRAGGGNPVLFPKALFPELMALTGDAGGSAVIRRHAELLRLTEAGSPRELSDVDYPEEL